MGEVVNLRLARKAKARSAKAAEADENRARFGQPKHVRENSAALRQLEKRNLDGHRLTDKPDDV